MTSHNTLGTGTKIGYATGSLATGAFGTVPGLILLIYLTDTLGVAAGIAGLVVFLPKFWDVVFNPIVGAWSDRTNSRMGPRRPWMLAGGILLPISFVFLFATPAVLGPSGSAVYVMVFFLLSAAAYALFQVPYVSLPAEMTDDYEERTSIVSFRIVALTLGILFSGALAPILVSSAADERRGYMLMGLVVAAFMAISMILSVIGTRSAPRTTVPRGDASLLVAFKAARSNPYFLPLWITFIIQALATAAMLASIPFLARYILDNDAASSTLFVALVAPAILFTPLWKSIGNRVGKTKGYVMASLCFLAAAIAIAFAQGIPLVGLYLAVVVAGIGYAGMQLFPLAMLPDTVSVDEARSGERRSGMLTGLWTAGETGAFAVGPALVGALLGLFGFVSTSSDETVSQPDSALFGITIAAGVLPALAMGVSLLVLRRYRLSASVLQEELTAAGVQGQSTAGVQGESTAGVQGESTAGAQKKEE